MCTVSERWLVLSKLHQARDGIARLPMAGRSTSCIQLTPCLHAKLSEESRPSRRKAIELSAILDPLVGNGS